MAKVLVTPRSLKSPDHPALEPLRKAGHEIVIPAPGRLPDPDTLKKVLPGCAGWLAGVEKITEDILAAGSDLRIISRNGVGVDNIDLAAARAQGIEIANTPGANARGVAELALALMFAVARNLGVANSSIKAGGWDRVQGIELEGKVLGVVGCGQIGKILARLGVGVGMRAAGFDLYPDPAFSCEGFEYVSLEVLTSLADVVSVHIPGGEKPLVNAEFLSLLKPGAIVINTSRAGAVDAEAMCDALDSGRLFGYGVDVFDPEPPGVTRLTSHPRVFCTSHIGGFTGQSVLRAATAASVNIVEKLK